MEESLAKLCELRDIARNLDKNINRSWTLILIPNLMCIAGAFTMGFGVMASVFTNNVAALAALANGMLPLRRIAHEQAEQELKQELREMYNGEPERPAPPTVLDAHFVRIDEQLSQPQPRRITLEAPHDTS